MCNAFSCICKENGDVLWSFGTDSHSEILEKFGVVDNENRPDFVKFAKVEVTPQNRNYLNPNSWVLTVDEQVKPTWWSKAHEQFCMEEHAKWLKQLNKMLVRKPIVNPFKDVKPPKRITKKHLDLLRKWDSVWSSIRASVWNSVGGSVSAYSGSFFNLSREDWKRAENVKTKGYPFQPAVDLWELGLVPSFDGKVWRLHGGKDAKVLWKGKLK